MPDETVLEDPAADDAYTYLRRAGRDGLDVDALAVESGMTTQESAAGLRLLVEGGFARMQETDGRYFTADEEEPSRPLPQVGANGQGADAEDVEQPEEQPRAPGSATEQAFAQIDSNIVLALARGERVRLRIHGWAEVVDGDLKLLDVLSVEEARMPGERPVGE